MTKTQAKRIARQHSIDFTIVERVHQDIRRGLESQLKPAWELRREAYRILAPTCQTWWRTFGNQSIREFDGAFIDGDYTRIPRFDEVADELVGQFPEFVSIDSPSETLFEFIRSPYQRMPPESETWPLAIDACMGVEHEPEDDVF